jgi:hypothetical protein
MVGLDAAHSDRHRVRRSRTDSRGTFRFERIPAGYYQLQVLRIGYSPLERPVEVPDGGASLILVMERLSRLDTLVVRASRSGIFGMVIARDGFKPLGQARVEAIGTYRGGPRTTSAEDGRFELASARPGPYLVRVIRPGYQTRSLSVLVPVDGAIELALVLDSLTGSDSETREQMLWRDFDHRAHFRGTLSALITGHGLPRSGKTSLAMAFQKSPSFLLSGLVLRDSLACIYIDGRPTPGITAHEIDAAAVEAVEVYGMRSLPPGPATLPSWPAGVPCGRGSDLPAPSDRKTGLQPKGIGAGRITRDDYVRQILVWSRK